MQPQRVPTLFKRSDFVWLSPRGLLPRVFPERSWVLMLDKSRLSLVWALGIAAE